MNQPSDWDPAPPPGRFQIGLLFKLGHVAEAKIGKDRHGLRHPDHSLQLLVIQNTHPADADAFGPGGQPQILNGATGAVQVRGAHRGTTEHIWSAAPPAACDAQIDRCFFYPFQLQPSIERPSGTCILAGCSSVGIQKQVFDCALRRTIADDHKIPRLHESHRTRLMRRRQHPYQHVIRNRIGQEISAYITAREYHPIDGIPLCA